MTDFFYTSQHYYWNVNILKISELSKFLSLKKPYKSRVCIVLSCLGTSISLSLEALMISSLKAIKTLCVADFVAYIYFIMIVFHNEILI